MGAHLDRRIPRRRLAEKNHAWWILSTAAVNLGNRLRIKDPYRRQANVAKPSGAAFLNGQVGEIFDASESPP